MLNVDYCFMANIYREDVNPRFVMTTFTTFHVFLFLFFFSSWVITLNSVAARNRIAGTALHIKGQKVTLRRYDDIIQLEYRKCSRSTVVQSMVTKIQKLDSGLE